jgi:uncharacterized protein YecE (DUF72 family)
MLYIGTCGYSYDDWVGPFYAEGLPKKEFLDCYTREFDTVELNTTFYRVPDQSFMLSLSRKTPADFLFFVKAYQGLTHSITENTPRELESFVNALSPLAGAGKLGGVLLQFPYSFHRNERNEEHLAYLIDGFLEVSPVVEFRNREWLADEVLALLSRKGAGFCAVDQPALRGLLPSEAIVTSARTGYVRFHGRNMKKWWDHEQAWERYDYLYTESELTEWVEKIRDMAGRTERTFVFFNNHRNAQAVMNARQMKHLLLG